MQTPIASQALPSRLVHAADLIHEGSFGVPDGDGFEYTHGVLAYHAANDSLLLVGHGQRQEVAEISIPAAGGRAVLLKDFRDILDGRLPDISPSESAEPMIGGMYVEGDRMVVSAYVYYDASHRAVASHFVRPADLDRSEVS